MPIEASLSQVIFFLFQIPHIKYSLFLSSFQFPLQHALPSLSSLNAVNLEHPILELPLSSFSLFLSTLHRIVGLILCRRGKLCSYGFGRLLQIHWQMHSCMFWVLIGGWIDMPAFVKRVLRQMVYIVPGLIFWNCLFSFFGTLVPEAQF